MSVPTWPTRGLIVVVLLSLCGLAPAGLGDAGDGSDPLCGLYCLHVAQTGLGAPVPLAALRKDLGDPGPAGYSMGALAEVAGRRGLHVLPVVTSFENLRRRDGTGARFACVAHVDAARDETGDAGGHFLLLAGFTDDGQVRVIDPPDVATVSPYVFGSRWDGTALLLSPDPLTPEEDLPVPIPWGTVLWIAAGALVLAAAGRALYRRRSLAAAGLLAALVLPGCGGADRPAAPTAAAGPPAGPPRASFETDEIDLGQVAVTPAGHTARFSVMNRGLSDLRILNLSLSCTCTEAVPTAGRLAPGEAGEIRVTVTPAQAERRSAAVTVATDDPRRPQTRLRVRWEAVAPRRFEPDALDFGRVRPGQTLTRTVALPVRPLAAGNAGDGRAASPGRVGPPTATKSLAADPAPAGGGRADRVTVTLTAPTVLGPGRGRVTVPLTDGFTEQLTLPVRWDVRDTVEVLPSRLYLGEAAPGAPLTGRLTVLADGPLEVESAILGGFPDASATVRPVSVEEAGETSTRRAAVTVAAAAPSAVGPHTADLTLTIAAPDRRTLTVPVSVLVGP